MPTWRSLAAAVLTWFAGECVAQAPARRPVLGRVVASSGEAITGATVRLVGFPSHMDPQRDAPDVVEAATDARGQFRAEVIAGLPYFGFACGPATATGAVARSQLHGWFGAGAFVEFECGAPDGPFAVQVDGLDAWSDDAPLTFWAWPRCGQRVLPFALPVVDDGKGRVAWPPLPLGRFEVRAGIEPLALVASLSTAQEAAALSAPRIIPCRVVDERGAPVAGAEVHLRVGHYSDSHFDGIETLMWRPRTRLLARTAADGTAQLRLPAAGDGYVRPPARVMDPGDHWLVFSARLPGRAQGSLWLSSRLLFDGAPADAEERAVHITLPPARPLRGTVRQGDRPAAAGATVRAYVVGKVPNGLGFSLDWLAFDGTVDADGRFAIDGLVADVHELRVALLPRDRGLPFTSYCFACHPTEPIDLDLTAAGTLQLTLLDATHGPARGHCVYVQPLQREHARAPSPERRAFATMRTCVDEAGRGEWKLADGDWFVFAGDDAGAAYAIVKLAAGQSRAIELALQPYTVLRGTLLDEQGKRCAGARVEVCEDTFAERRGEATLASQCQRRRFERLLDAVTTQADGSFTLPCPSIRDHVLTVRFCCGDRRSEEFGLTADASPLRLRLQ